MTPPPLPRHTGFSRWHGVIDWAEANSLDILVALTAGAAVALVLVGLRSLLQRVFRAREDSPVWRRVVGRVARKTTSFFIIAAAAKLVAGQADPPAVLDRTIDILFIVAAAFQGAIWGRELILGFVQHRVGEGDAQSSLGSAIGIIRVLVTVALFAIAIIVILDNLGVNVTALVAGLGIGGIAIGLAAQGIFSDLFAALSIILDRPFRKGQAITFGTTTGTVEHIGLKSTRVRSVNGEEVVISNTKLLEQQVQNWALLTTRRGLMIVALSYHTQPELLARLGEEVRSVVLAQARTTFDRAHVFRFSPSSLDMEIVFHVESDDYGHFMDVQQGIVLGVLRRFEELGVHFAFPATTNYAAAPDGRLIMPYAEHREQPEPTDH